MQSGRDGLYTQEYAERKARWYGGFHVARRGARMLGIGSEVFIAVDTRRYV